jgi:hypothetical protein
MGDSGQAGQAGSTGTTPAPGGLITDGSLDSGNGGSGGAGTTPDGLPGLSGPIATGNHTGQNGGGGGGAAGRIRINTNSFVNQGAIFSPSSLNSGCTGLCSLGALP